MVTMITVRICTGKIQVVTFKCRKISFIEKSPVWFGSSGNDMEPSFLGSSK